VSAGDASPCEVTIVVHDLGPVGGMERVLTELVLGLRKLGHPLTVIARTCELPPEAGVVFHRVRGPARPFLLAYPWFMLAGSVTLARRRRGIVQATGAIVLGHVDVLAVHYCHQVGPANPSRATPMFRAHAGLVRRLKRLGERLCFRWSRAASFVCVSEGVAEEVRTHFPELAERVLTIHNGVDTMRFAPARHLEQARALRASLGIDQERLVAVMVGGEWERKGLGPLIEALALAREWDLVVAGEGDRDGYRLLASSLGVGESVHWLGVKRDVEHIYALADAFVLASSYETFSLVTFEAAASGLPILATAVNGVRELIEDRRNGFVITRDPATIAERLTRLAADPALRRRLGAAAREAALRFSWEEMVAAHDRLYGRLSRRRGSASAPVDRSPPRP
jgi:UDP-glucose:(heptosyl)LPS alpha-1,3-glucosyltransferase